MKKHLFIWLVMSLLIIDLRGQEAFYTVKGFVKDSLTFAALQSVSITTLGNTGYAITDKSGFFRISVQELPCTLIVSNVGYYEKQFIVESLNAKINILLKDKVSELPELSVTVEKPVPITKEEPLYISDFEIVQDRILALAYRNRMLSQARLYMMTLDGDTLFSVPVSKPQQLYKDCFDNDYFISRSDAFQLSIDSLNIEFLYPYPTDEFISVFSILSEARNDKMYLKKYSLHDQKLEYVEYDKYEKTYSDIISVENESNVRMLRDRSRIIAAADDPEVQARFEDLAFYKPVFAPLLNINDTLCLFNFEDSWIGFYNDSSQLIETVPITFNNDKSWERELYFDEGAGKVYAMFRKDGISTLKEISLMTGQLINSIQIPDLPYVDHIKIDNGKLYFLYTDHSSSNEMRMLYSMKI